MIQVALAIISNKNNEVLLQHRDNNAPTNPNKWGLWGGRIEGGETPLEAIVRELKEELDIDVDEESLTPFNTYKAQRFGDDWEGYVFHLQDGGDFKYNLQEGDDLKFISSEVAKILDIDSIARPIVLEYFEKSHSDVPAKRLAELQYTTLVASTGASTRLAGSKLSDEEVEKINKSSEQK